MTPAFKPAYQGTATVSVTASSSATALPAGGENVLIQNSSATVIVFAETGNKAITAAVASGTPILPGGKLIIRRKMPGDPQQQSVGDIDSHIALIGSAAGPTNVYVTVGAGGL